MRTTSDHCGFSDKAERKIHNTRSAFHPFHALLVFVAFALLLVRCSNPSSYNKFIDPELLHIAQLTDERNSDSLFSYLTHPQPLLRVEAAYAFASIRDPRAVDKLHKSIQDPVAAVRAAAAYALGQTLHPSSIEPLAIQLRFEGDAGCVIAMAEALGKIAGGLHVSGSTPDLIESAAHAVYNLEKTDSVTVHAKAKAAFWLHNSGWQDMRFMNSLAGMFASQPVVNRRIIAYAMGRFRGNWHADTLKAERFLKYLTTESDTLCIAAAMPVAGKTSSRYASSLIERFLTSTSASTELLIACCRASSNNAGVGASSLLPLIKHPSANVSETACFALEQKELTDDDRQYLHASESKVDIRMQAALTRLFHQKGESLPIDPWIEKIDTLTNTYDRVACIRMLGCTGTIATTCFNRALTESNVVIANAYVEAFIESHKQADFPTDIDFPAALNQLIQKKDIGITALCAAESRNIEVDEEHKRILNNTLSEALTALTLPKELETANEIIKTLNEWGITPMKEKKADINHPIDWKLVKSIPRKQLAKIVTSKGEIVIELHVEEAPGSVASFVELVRSGFYNDKFFHRVVPNFVIQGGCPRGDGMGGTDYTLRSEFRLHDYRTGSVGLASSGPDTESCQWFINHIPTPHLEGRYTIFAHVTDGMSVVDQIEIGDRIVRVELI
jgi:cyclophilin family peptidyl-prolyl cis-trans isomerase/HEAT repeat protein